jgi:hypothetical protein
MASALKTSLLRLLLPLLDFINLKSVIILVVVLFPLCNSAILTGQGRDYTLL